MLPQCGQMGILLPTYPRGNPVILGDYLSWGYLGTARRAWLTKDDVLNPLQARKFAKAMKHGW